MLGLGDGIAEVEGEAVTGPDTEGDGGIDGVAAGCVLGTGAGAGLLTGGEEVAARGEAEDRAGKGRAVGLDDGEATAVGRMTRVPGTGVRPVGCGSRPGRLTGGVRGRT
ncbi:hypothetical protein G3I21_20560, partial [Streptomyces bauhiniae]|nr:hypothetical protein [Streptomyces bauhiniae]